MEKYDLAADESYRDLTNLLPKLQKHMALEAEITQNKTRLNSLNSTGNQMISDQHYATPEIRETLGRVNSYILRFYQFHLLSHFYTIFWGYQILYAFPVSGNNLGQVVHTHVPLSPSSIIWYRSRSSDALRLGR